MLLSDPSILVITTTMANTTAMLKHPAAIQG